MKRVGRLPVHPFDPQRRMGTVSFVGPTSAKVNLPRASDATARLHHGSAIPAGEVGEFVLIENGDLGIFGRLVEVSLPERDRLSVEPELGRVSEAHPVGRVQLLSTLDLASGRVITGVMRHPRLGSPVYSAHPEIMKWIVEGPSGVGEEGEAVAIRVGSLPMAAEAVLAITPGHLFGRHCAVLGATGGGKSWTVARLVQEAARFNSKIVLLDASGEFHRMSEGTTHVHLGDGVDGAAASAEVVFPYTELTEMDLAAIFTPSLQSQAPKFRAAIKSLKLAKLEPALAPSGLVVKANRPKQAYDAAERTHGQALLEPRAEFEIERLAAQIDEECVYVSGGSASAPNFAIWGNYVPGDKSYCSSLISRIESIRGSRHLAPIFSPGNKQPISVAIDAFLADASARVLRVSLKHLSFDHNAREIVANAIGRHLLALAREGRFQDHPLVVFLDEAHQFLNKTLGDESNRHALDSFALIAKEGRKYALTICIATQRPRDIPEDVLSQMGTLIVHRLINDRDREVVERASGEIDKSAADFLPTLGPGEAVIIGVDFPMPLQVQITAPGVEPESQGPDYQRHWRRARPTAEGEAR